MRLNLGCGSRLMQGYLNVDYKRPEIDLSGQEFKEANCQNLSFLADNSVEEIYAEQLIEHIHPMDIPEMLYEWCRVLTPGGKLILIFPDFDKVVHLYLAHGKLETADDLFWYHRLCYAVLNSTKQALAKSDSHRSLITVNYLQLQLGHEGFKMESAEDFGSNMERLYYTRLVAIKERQS